MFRIFDDVKIISTPPAIYVDYYFCSRKTKAKSSSRFFSIIKTSCSVACHWTMICAAASLIFRDTHGRNCICTRYTHNKLVKSQCYRVARFRWFLPILLEEELRRKVTKNTYSYENTRKTWNTDFIIVCQNLIGLYSWI